VNKDNIILYGSEKCHKTKYYKSYLKEKGFSFLFKDVIVNTDFGLELKGMYETGKLNFPTLIVCSKKLRNPSNNVLDTWLNKINK
jgi:arsenate reductase-like glutaredoxin family protein